MHIGGMRTALFNWLWARHNGGQFVLRIDDTDRQRNVEEALEPILNAFRWLELDWDEGPEVGGDFGPYFQSERDDLYRAAFEKLLDSGKAYRDFDPPEMTKADRETAEKEKRSYINIRRSLDLSHAEAASFLEEGRPHVVRFLVPRDEKVAIDDHIRGHVEWDCSLIPDPVIMRSDGSPLYNFATVVDDSSMQISHVIRAEEHLSNTPVQVLIHNAMGNKLPEFAHIPYVAAPASKEKLSKRKLDKYRKNQKFRRMFEAADRVFPRISLSDSTGLDPVMVEYYERIGYLPAAVLNGLARLGWSLDDKTEILSRDTLVKEFTLQRVVKAPAGFDPEKLDSYQAHWVGELSLDEKIDRCIPYLVKANLIDESVDDEARTHIGTVLSAMDDRLKIFADILEFDEFFVADAELAYDEKAFTKRVRKEGAAERLRSFRDHLEDLNTFDADSTDKALHDFVEADDIKIGEIIHALRVAVSGKAKGVGMFDCLSVLGKKRSLARIDRALGMV
jgi:glutamyl-tRNA synthetase